MPYCQTCLKPVVEGPLCRPCGDERDFRAQISKWVADSDWLARSEPEPILASVQSPISEDERVRRAPGVWSFVQEHLQQWDLVRITFLYTHDSSERKRTYRRKVGHKEPEVYVSESATWLATSMFQLSEHGKPESHAPMIHAEVVHTAV